MRFISILTFILCFKVHTESLISTFVCFVFHQVQILNAVSRTAVAAAALNTVGDLFFCLYSSLSKCIAFELIVSTLHLARVFYK